MGPYRSSAHRANRRPRLQWPECAAIIEGIAKPEWYQGVSWLDHERGVMWRADETQLVEAEPVRRGVKWTAEATSLSDAWWATLTRSLLPNNCTGSARPSSTCIPLTAEQVDMPLAALAVGTGPQRYHTHRETHPDAERDSNTLAWSLPRAVRVGGCLVQPALLHRPGGDAAGSTP
jgi:hypothetical protein